MKRNEWYGKVFYYPYYLYRTWPSLTEGLVALIDHMAMKCPIWVYPTEELARHAGEKMLCDDDTYGILVIDCQSGWPRVCDINDKGKPWDYAALSEDIMKQIELGA